MIRNYQIHRLQWHGIDIEARHFPQMIAKAEAPKAVTS